MKRKWLIICAILVMCIAFAGAFYFFTNKTQSHVSHVKTQKMLRLASWNVCNFGRSKNAEEIRFMAHILRDVDIVALQEISTSEFGAQAVAQLADELDRTGAKWDYLVSDATSGPGTERYAFLFKAHRVWINRNDNTLVSALSDRMDREPASMIFHSGDKTVAVISFHLQPDDPHKDKDPRKELKTIQEHAEGFMRGPTILVGDFNLSHGDMHDVFEKGLGFVHHIEGKTSLKMKKEVSGEYLHRAYDNIYSRGVIVHESGIRDFVPQFPDLKSARQISDHLPVFIVFSL